LPKPAVFGDIRKIPEYTTDSIVSLAQDVVKNEPHRMWHGYNDAVRPSPHPTAAIPVPYPALVPAFTLTGQQGKTIEKV